MVLLVALGILARAVRRRARSRRWPLRRGQPRPPARALAFFAAIGLGFLLLEIVLIQRFVLFLGFPTYALSVVLFALLVFTGLGSYASARWSDPRRVAHGRPRRRLRAAAACSRSRSARSCTR